MNIIRILPEAVSIQIAAGEVIERPASVVRELLDNCIDAQADKIEIKIEDGGKRLIQISDNGIGMNRDDLLLSLERHATSKIHSISDLTTVRTLGFRGEALPSISSVSRMEIISRLKDQLAGHRVTVTGGRLKSIDETGAPVGTTAIVRDLFYNIPARRKFLRSAKTETAHILDIISRIILPFSQIRLRFDNMGRNVLHFPVTRDARDRLSVIMGKDTAQSFIHAQAEENGVKISAFLSPPDQSRNRGDRIYVYLNNRNIRDKLVTRALMEGYGQRLMKGRYPQVVIFIEIDASDVDVNVHPTKQEIRFREGPFIYRTIASVVGKALRDQFQSFSDLNHVYTEIPTSSATSDLTVAEQQWAYNDGGKTNKLFNNSIEWQQYTIKESVRIIGQLKHTYILCQTKDGLLLLDQHAAHERIVYETLKKSYRSSRIESQDLLIPYSLELSLKESNVILGRLDQLESLGLVLDHFGGNTFMLRSIPSVLVDAQWDQFLLDLIPIMESEDDLTSEQALDKLWTVMACHSAIRAGQSMSDSEMIRLIDQLEQMDLPTNCPHGRPIFKLFSYGEIEKMFKRIV